MNSEVVDQIISLCKTFSTPVVLADITIVGLPTIGTWVGHDLVLVALQHLAVDTVVCERCFASAEDLFIFKVAFCLYDGTVR